MSIKHPFWHPSLAEAFILDWDGILADTHLDFSEIRDKYFDGKNVPLLEASRELPKEKRITFFKELEELEIAGAEKAEPVNGVEQLIQWLDTHSKKWCIVSRNCRKALDTAAKKLKIEMPDIVMTRDNAKYTKPDSRAFDEAAELMGVNVTKCVAVGDFFYDVECARRSGSRAILIGCENNDWQSWADATYETLIDFIDVLKRPQNLVPWEYRKLHRKRGNRWFDAVSEAVFAFPEGKMSPTMDCWLWRAASLGIKYIYIDKKRIFTPEDWQKSSSFPISSLGRPLYKIAREYCERRFPMVEIVTERVNGKKPLKASRNSLDLKRFVERKLL